MRILSVELFSKTHARVMGDRAFVGPNGLFTPAAIRFDRALLGSGFTIDIEGRQPPLPTNELWLRVDANGMAPTESSLNGLLDSLTKPAVEIQRSSVLPGLFTIYRNEPIGEVAVSALLSIFKVRKVARPANQPLETRVGMVASPIDLYEPDNFIYVAANPGADMEVLELDIVDILNT